MPPPFILEGADELRRTLRKLADGREVNKLIRRSLRMAAGPVLETSRLLAPFLSGDLRRSLKIRSAKRSRKRIAIVVRPGTRAELGIPSSAKGYYPAHQAIGARGGRLKATRYLRDSMEQNRQGSIQILNTNIGKGIEAIAARGAARSRGGAAFAA